MISRHLSAERINEVCNHPAVRRYVANGTEPLDLTRQVADTRNILLMGEHGGMMFLHVLDGVYECHTQVLPEGRGQWTRQLTEACMRTMFTRTDAYEIVTRVPTPHVAAKAATVAQGMTYEFTRENGVIFRDRVCDVDIYSLRIQEWVARAPGLIEVGAWLHGRMEAEAKRLGITVPPHADDENHNRYVGAAALMAFGGAGVKAVMTYNRWSTLARHMRDGEISRVSLVSAAPVVIRIDIGLLKFHTDDIEVIREC
jgi:hypothetical protein